MNALDPAVAEFRERLTHQSTEKKRRLYAMNCKPENSRFLAALNMPVRFCRTSREHPRATIKDKIVGKNLPALNYSARVGREPS
jgi:hypothetical protein